MLCLGYSVGEYLQTFNGYIIIQFKLLELDEKIQCPHFFYKRVSTCKCHSQESYKLSSYLNMESKTLANNI